MGGLTEAQFWARVRVGEPADCWPWLGPKHPRGYARASWGGRGRRVMGHRVAYALAQGISVDDLPHFTELQLDHLCRNRICVNPAHLELVTRRENILRGVSSAARHATKTHCPQGHPYSEENTSVYKNQRRCRTCHRERQAAYRLRLGHTQLWAD